MFPFIARSLFWVGAGARVATMQQLATLCEQAQTGHIQDSKSFFENTNHIRKQTKLGQ